MPGAPFACDDGAIVAPCCSSFTCVVLLEFALVPMMALSADLPVVVLPVFVSVFPFAFVLILAFPALFRPGVGVGGIGFNWLVTPKVPPSYFTANGLGSCSCLVGQSVDCILFVRIHFCFFGF